MITQLPMNSIGWNVKKGALPHQAIAKLRQFLKANHYDEVHLAIYGGTISQRSKEPLTDDHLKEYARLQRDFQQVRYYFGINLNETFETNKEELYRAIDAGLHFEAAMLGAENYLPKYLNGDMSKPEVTKRTAYMDFEKYVEFAKEYYGLGLRQIWQLAPVKGIPAKYGKDRDKYAKKWNKYLLSKAEKLGAVMFDFHVYASVHDGKTYFDFEYAKKLFKKVDSMERRLLITEFGQQDPTEDPLDGNFDTLQFAVETQEIGFMVDEIRPENSRMFSHTLFQQSKSKVSPFSDMYLDGDITNEKHLNTLERYRISEKGVLMLELMPSRKLDAMLRK